MELRATSRTSHSPIPLTSIPLSIPLLPQPASVILAPTSPGKNEQERGRPCLKIQAMKTVWQTTREVSLSLGLIVMIGLLGGGCQTPDKSFVFSPLPDDGSRDSEVRYAETNRFAVGDLVTVSFSGTADQIPTHDERIKEDGTITLPLIGAVKAAGKTPVELQSEIHDLYVPRYYKQLTVTPWGGELVYYVGGQVCSPGRQLYVGATTVLKAIESAGGFTEYAARRRVELIRTNGKRFRVDCINGAKDVAFDLPVYPGDKINVPMRQDSVAD